MLKPNAKLLAAIGIFLMIGLMSTLPAGAVFYDFSSNPPPDWRNEFGNWKADGGYFAQSPTNTPPTYSTLPWVLTDFVVEVDVKGVSDGGIFFRTTWDPVDHNAIDGVLLIVGGNQHSGTGFYWHTIAGKGYSGFLGQSGPLFNQGDDIHVRVEVQGNTYKAYCNYSATPDSTLAYSGVASGYVALYDFTGDVYGSQRFDNFSVPLPPALLLFGSGLLAVVASRRRR